MGEKYFQQVMLVRENLDKSGLEAAKGWINSEGAFVGALVELLDLPNPRDFWTVREVYSGITTESYMKEQQKLSRNSLPSIQE